MTNGTASKDDRFPREFGIAAACCKSSFHGASDEPPIDLAGTDWPRLLRLARFHRVQGLLWKRLASSPIPEHFSRALADDAAAIAASNLRAAAECRDLSASFEASEVPLLFLKGLSLGVLAYANPALKSAIDIDLLIDPTNLDLASGLLRDQGYRMAIPREGSSLHRWHRRSKESVWLKDDPQLQIDLHTRTADNPRLIPLVDVHSPRQTVEVGSGIRLATLADDQLFAYLSIHGASSAWFRLKWIADFAGLLGWRGADELDHLYRRSQELGAGRSAGQALLLSDRLFGTLRSVPRLKEELLGDRSTRQLYRVAFRLLVSEHGEPTEHPFGTLPIHWTQFLMLQGPSYKLSELLRQARALARNLS
jgi:hypothetical protein